MVDKICSNINRNICLISDHSVKVLEHSSDEGKFAEYSCCRDRSRTLHLQDKGVKFAVLFFDRLLCPLILRRHH